MSSRAPALTGVLASAGLLLAAVAPAQAVTTWNWSFSSPYNRSGSGTFTTADVTPTAGVDIQITGISGTILAGGTPFTITSLSSTLNNIFRWDGTGSSQIITESNFLNSNAGVSFDTGNGEYRLTSNDFGFDPVQELRGESTAFSVDSSSVQPVFAPPPSAVPGPLPLLGAAAAFGASRRLRHRIKLHNSTRIG